MEEQSQTNVHPTFQSPSLQPAGTKPVMMRVLIELVVVVVYLLLYWLLKLDATAGWIEGILFGIGLVGGSGLVFADELLFAQQYTEPGDKVRPLSKSIVFLFALIPAGVFVLTSTGSELALGFFLGVATTLIGELLVLFSQPQAIRDLFLWQLQRQLTDPEVRGLALVLAGFLGVLSLLVFL